jgi:hypothetical protein
MRRNLIVFVVVAGTIGVSGWGVVSNGHARSRIVPSLHAAPNGGCSVATLSGDYLLVGEAVPTLDRRDDPSFPRRFAGIHTFDGEGHLSGFVTSNQGGVIQRFSNEGTYTLEANCTGTVTSLLPAEGHWDLFITKDGSEGHYVRTDEGFIATRSIKRQ